MTHREVNAGCDAFRIDSRLSFWCRSLVRAVLSDPSNGRMPEVRIPLTQRACCPELPPSFSRMEGSCCGFGGFRGRMRTRVQRFRTTRDFWPIEPRSVRGGRKNDTPRSRSRPEQADPTLMFGATRVSTTTWPIEALWARSARSPVSMLSCLPRRTLAYHS